MTATPLTVRWTIGDVSDEGFEALSLSIHGARRLFGPGAQYVVCVNTIPLDEARARAGAPDDVEWIDATRHHPAFLLDHFDDGMAEGAGWKLAPPRIAPDRHELALDNDCILWRVPPAIAAWLARDDFSLVAEDVATMLGAFSDLTGDAPRNLGIRGLPPGLDLESAMQEVLRHRPVRLGSELDEQGLQLAAVSREHPPLVVPTSDVTICSPFPPHQPHLGRCGAHFVGLNAREMSWSLDGRPAVAHIREHWRRHRELVYRHVGMVAIESRVA